MTTDDIILSIFYLAANSLPNTAGHSQVNGTLPERTRLAHLLLANPTFFTVIESYPIELIFPIHEGQSDQQVGKRDAITVIGALS